MKKTKEEAKIKTIKAAVVYLLKTAGYNGLAEEVKTGEQTIEATLKWAARFSDGKEKESFEKALRLIAR